MSLCALPNELILLIAENLKPGVGDSTISPSHLSHLLQANRHFSVLLAPLLHEVALRDRGHLSALAWAALRGREPLARLALDHGCDANAATTGGDCFYTPLLWAVEGGSEEVLRLLLERGAEVNLGVPRFTPLHLAIEHKQDGIAKILLDRGADVELREDMGLAPLLMARCEKTVGLLLDYGADIDVQGRDGATALHLASLWPGRESVVRVLLERGASFAIVDSGGMTARQRAVAAGLQAIETLLLEREHEVGWWGEKQQSDVERGRGRGGGGEGGGEGEGRGTGCARPGDVL